MNIQFGSSPHFKNKENCAPYVRKCQTHSRLAQEKDPTAPDVYDKCWAFSQFRTTALSPEGFIEHVLSGKAWTPSIFSHWRRTNENWQQAEMIALDYDNNVSVIDCLSVGFIQRHALLVHPSASSGKLDDNGNLIHKTRVIFRIDQVITNNFEAYRLAVQALCRHLGLDVDPASFKPAQLFYGSDNSIEAPYTHPEHVLPNTLLDELIAPLKAEIERKRADAERLRAEQHYQPAQKSSDRVARSIEYRLHYAYRKVAATRLDRTGSAHDQAWWLARFLACWPISESQIERTLLDASRANGASEKYGENEMLRHIRNGIKSGKLSDAEPLELPERYVAQRPAVSSAQQSSRIALRIAAENALTTHNPQIEF